MELGFNGERFIYIPTPFLKRMEDSPYMSGLYIYALGYFPHAYMHYIDRPEGCDEHLLIYCTDGCGWVILNNARYRLVKNQFIILPGGIPHKYMADCEDPWSIYWIHFTGSNSDSLVNGFDRPTDVGESFEVEKASDLFEEIYSALGGKLDDDHLHFANMCLPHLLATLCFPKIHPHEYTRKGYSENKMNRMIKFMNEHVESNLKMKDFTAFCGYSESYFYRKFVKVTGCAPMKYYMRLRIGKACDLLLNTDLKINQISYKLGFRDPQHFSRMFTKDIGCSAMEFRKKKMIKAADSAENR